MSDQPASTMMGVSNFDDVGQFHEKFRLDNTTYHGYGPRIVPEGLLLFRLRFLLEEVDEFQQGLSEKDITQMADALVDLVYVAMGTAHLLGLPWQELWHQVQEANMKKVRAASDASDSKRGSSFDVVKPEGWVAPDIKGVLNGYGWDL